MRPELRARLPRRTVRLRLTLLYGGLYLVSGAVLLAVTYALVSYATSGIAITNGPHGLQLSVGAPAGLDPPTAGTAVSSDGQAVQ